MPNPLVVGVLALISTSIMFLEWIVFEPIFSNLEATALANVAEQALPSINTLHYTCYLLPIGISIALWIWVFLAVTKRLVVTQPSGPY